VGVGGSMQDSQAYHRPTAQLIKDVIVEAWKI